MVTRGMNTEGLLQDIHEDSGYDRWDLTLTVIEQVITDVNSFLESGKEGFPIESGEARDKDFLYALINLIDTIHGDDLYKFLPKDNRIYLPELCGDYRIPDLTIHDLPGADEEFKGWGTVQQPPGD